MSGQSSDVTDAWFAEITAIEDEGDHRFSRQRSPHWWGNGKHHRAHHVFTSDQRKRMDGYESIDYFEPQSLIYKQHLTVVSGDPRWVKWAVYIVLGAAIGLWACLLFQTLDFISNSKRSLVEMVINDHSAAASCRAVNVSLCNASTAFLNSGGVSPHLTRSGIGWYGAALGYLTLLAFATTACFLSSLCCYFMPTASGSGVPDVMAYLNGVMLPKVFNVKNLLFKTVSCILAVSGGLFGGVEGSMIHIGSLIGAGLPTGRSRTLKFSNKFLSMFRNTKDHRDFITAGAACGVTSAFSSPIGGLLFVMEEVATFFPIKLAWMVFVSALACTFTMQLVNTFLQGWTPNAMAPTNGNFADTAITMFKTQFTTIPLVPLNLLTFVPTIVAGVVLGLLSVAFVRVNQRVNRFRARYITVNMRRRVSEPALFVAVLVTFCYLTPLAFPCVPTPTFIKQHSQTIGIELWTAFCPDRENQYHPLATLTLTNSYNVVRALFVRGCPELFPLHSLLIFQAIYTLGAMYCGGMFTSIGTVMPTIVIGATGGRLLGVLFDEPTWADPGLISLIGAASYFGGISRLTFSLIVIMMELTNDLSHVSCLMVGIVIAKYVADYFCHSIYHASLETKCIPYLPVDSDIHELDTFSAKDIMSAPVVSLKTIDTLPRLIEVLKTTKHNSFPVVSVSDGMRYRGMLQRRQLELLLWYIYFRETSSSSTASVVEHSSSYCSEDDGGHASYQELRTVEERIFWEHLPSVPPMDKLPVMMNSTSSGAVCVDLNPYMDGSALYVRNVMSLSRTYKMFQNMALRHLPVVDRHNYVVGILTRKNFVDDRMQERLNEVTRVSQHEKRGAALNKRTPVGRCSRQR